MLGSESDTASAQPRRHLLWRASVAMLVALPGVWLLGQTLASTSDRSSRVASDVTLSIAAGWAGVVCAAVARRISSRPLWSFAGFCTLYALGQLCWTGYDLMGRRPPGVSWLD
nr:hypothetical protein [Propionibacteriales bacterium]